MEILDRRQIFGACMMGGCVNLTRYLQNAQRPGIPNQTQPEKVLDGRSIMNTKGLENIRLQHLSLELYLVIIAASEKLEHSQRFM